MSPRVPRITDVVITESFDTRFGERHVVVCSTTDGVVHELQMTREQFDRARHAIAEHGSAPFPTGENA